MLTGFRRIIFSRVGGIVTLAFLVVIALAFAAGDITGLRPSGSGAAAGDTVAAINGEPIPSSELVQRARLEVEAVRQRNPMADMSQFIAAGGLESVLDRMINGLALQQFGEKIGLVVSKSSIDGQIAAIPAFQGFDGKFNQQTFDQRLRERGITADQLRADIRRETISNWLIAPTIGASQITPGLALPYASLLLEAREATIGFVPTEALAAGIKPDNAAIQAYFQRNRARYSIPERRVIRYALVTPDMVVAQAQPSDAEISKAYQDNRARFAESEQRSVRQVVIADRAAADRLAATVKSGTAIDQAARSAGLEPTSFTDLNKTELGQQIAPAVADAVFAAGEGDVVGPVRSPLGWHVARVEAVRKVPGRTLAEARETLIAELRQQKTAQALGDLQGRVDDLIADGSTFEEAVTEAKLKSTRTAPLLANGINPDAPAEAPDPALARIVQAGFAASREEPPQIVTTGENGSFALVAIDRIVPAAPPPLAQIQERVAADYVTEQALERGRKAASDIAARINGGMPLAEAIRQSGIAGLPAPRDARLTRAQLAAQQRQNQGRVPPAIEMMFAMKEGTAKIARGDDSSGWFVVHLTKASQGDAKGNQVLIETSRRALGSVIGREYAEQFVRAVERDVGVTRNQAVLRRVRSELAGQGAGQ